MPQKNFTQLNLVCTGVNLNHPAMRLIHPKSVRTVILSTRDVTVSRTDGKACGELPLWLGRTGSDKQVTPTVLSTVEKMNRILEET